MATGTTDKLLTADEYFRLPTPDHPTELVRGEIIDMNQPGFRHGELCSDISGLLREFAKNNNLGRVVSNDAGIITERDPDSVRGADVAYYSYERLPRDRSPQGYPDVPPDLVFEVLFPSNQWPQVLTKVAEYLQAGVIVAVVVDPKANQLHVYRSEGAGQPVAVLNESDEFQLPELLPGFSIRVGKLIRR